MILATVFYRSYLHYQRLKLGQNKLVVMDFNGPPERVYATLVCGQAALPWCGGPPPRPPLRAPLRSVARRTGARSRAEQEKAIFG